MDLTTGVKWRVTKCRISQKVYSCLCPLILIYREIGMWRLRFLERWSLWYIERNWVCFVYYSIPGKSQLIIKYVSEGHVPYFTLCMTLPCQSTIATLSSKCTSMWVVRPLHRFLMHQWQNPNLHSQDETFYPTEFRRLLRSVMQETVLCWQL